VTTLNEQHTTRHGLRGWSSKRWLFLGALLIAIVAAIVLIVVYTGGGAGGGSY
jgi:hypothetical protein